MQHKTVEMMWTDLESYIFRNVSVSETQRTEMRKAFHAGAYAILLAVIEAADRERDEGCKQIDDWLNELKAFGTALQTNGG